MTQLCLWRIFWGLKRTISWDILISRNLKRIKSKVKPLFEMCCCYRGIAQKALDHLPSVKQAPLSTFLDPIVSSVFLQRQNELKSAQNILASGLIIKDFKGWNKERTPSQSQDFWNHSIINLIGEKWKKSNQEKNVFENLAINGSIILCHES